MSDDNIVKNQILSFPLPDVIRRRIRGKSRYAVKTTGDLKIYIQVIENIQSIYRIKGIIDVIAELLNVTKGRVSEWKRIWKLSKKYAITYPRIIAMLDKEETPLKLLSDYLRNIKKQS